MVSTRGRITPTPTSFVNEYQWGEGTRTRGWRKYFDAFLYLSNWGTHVLRLRLPERFLDATTARQYCVGEHAWIRTNNETVILTFASEAEDDDRVEEEANLTS